MDQAQDQKKKQLAAVKSKAQTAKAGADVAKDKEELGAMLRPDKASADKQIGVGAKNDQAEKEADQIADAVAAPETSNKSSEKDDEDPDSSGHFFAPIRAPPIRAGPHPLLVRCQVADQNGNQPNTDDLKTVPAMDGQLADVGVGASEEAELDELSGNDYAVLGGGQSAIMMKATAAPDSDRPSYLSGTLAQLIQSPGAGSRLPESLRTRMESRLGIGLGEIRVHTGTHARLVASYIQARAFAYGKHVFLRESGDINNLKLMAHETAHCLQQGAGTPLLAHTARGPPSRAPPTTQQSMPTSLAAGAGKVRCLEAGEDGWLARRAEGIADRFDFYGLLKVLIGRRLFTGKSVRQDAMSYVGAFMKFIGADETFEQMKESGSLENGFRKIREGAEKYNLNWPRVRNLFSRAYDEFEWTSPIDSLKRIFKPFVSDLFSFGKLILTVIAELVAEAFVIGFGSRGKDVWEKIKAIGKVIGLIISNPLRFAMNLIRAAAQGIQNFMRNILTHIKKGLLAWVLGPLGAMGVTLPDKLDLRGIINILLQVIGLTYPQLRPRIVRKLNPRGELKVSLVEKLIKVVNILRTEGIAGIWRKLLDYITDLQTQVIAGIRNWVVKSVVQAGIRKLVAWSNPAGALIDILFTIYKLIVFFVERFEQIVSFASSIFDSIGKIARGQLNEASAYIENTLSLTIPIIIGFLASFLGLPDIAGTVRTIINNLRAKVHAAVDKVLDFIINKVKKLIARLVGKFKNKTGEPEQGVNMQGTQHKLAYAQEGRKRVLYMHSEKTEFNSECLRQNVKVMQDNCAPPITDKSQPQLQAAEKVLAAQEAKEAKLAHRTESNAAPPDKRADRDKSMQQLIKHMEAATDPNIRATDAVASGDEDVDKQPPQSTLTDGEKVPEDQKETVEPDMEDAKFRYVIVPEETNLEASWGPWKDMVGKREAFKTHLKEKLKLEGRYAVDLDHNPEYQILWRLGHLEFRQDQREKGDVKDQEGRMFPTIAAMYGNQPLGAANSRDRKGSDLDFVMAIRYDVHRELSNTQTPNVNEFKELCEYSDAQQAFVPKRDKTDDVVKKNWGGQIDGKAQEHQAEVDASYNKMFQDSFVSDETLALIRKSGPTMIANAGQVIAGSKPTLPNGEEAPGHLGGIGMKKDPVDAELVTGDYAKLGDQITALAPAHGKVFDKHHLIEKSILAVLQQRFTASNLLSAAVDPAQTVAGIAVKGQTLDKSAAAALKKVQKSQSKLTESVVESESETLLASDGFTPATAFEAGSTEAGGFAIAVLKVVNGLLGSQPASNIDTAIKTHLGPAVDQRMSAMRKVIASGYDGLQVADDATQADAVKALGAKTTSTRNALQQEVNGQFRQDLSKALPMVLDELTTHAHTDFTSKMNSSLGQTHPKSAAFPEGSEAAEVYTGLMQRYQEKAGNLEYVKAENRERWVA